MGYDFDGPTKIISLTAGTTALDIKVMYSAWKLWAATGDNSKYQQALAVVGGEPVDVGNGIYITSYYFLTNGWKIKPQEANHKLVVSNGVLLTDDGSDPFIQTTGAYNVLVQYSQPVRTETALLETGVSGLTVEESAQLLALPDASDVIRCLWSKVEINKVEGTFTAYDLAGTVLLSGLINDDGTVVSRTVT